MVLEIMKLLVMRLAIFLIYVAGGEWINHSSYIHTLCFHLLMELGVRAFEQLACWSML